jgi:hypothetical protein
MFEFLKKKEVLKKESLKPKGALAVEVIVPESNSLIESIGMSKERADELSKIAQTSYMTSSNLSEAAAKASEFCMHPNELFFVVHVLSDIHIQSKHASAMMEMMRNGLGGRK